MTLDPTQLQGNILRGYHFRHAAYLFVGVDDAAAGRALLGRLIDPVITEEEWGESPPWTLNVALSFAGLRAVGLSEAALARFPEEFRCGMAARADELGDVGTSAPDCWEKGLRARTRPISCSPCTRRPRARGTRSSARWLERGRAGARAACRLRAARRRAAGRARALRLRRRLLPAGGGGQPARPSRRGRAPAFLRRWRQIRLGEFVLGHRDEDGVVPARDLPLLHNGTFMVWRKLEQNVALFRSLGPRGGGRRPGRGGVDQGEDRRALAQRRLAGALAGRPRSGTRRAQPVSVTAATRRVCAARWALTCAAPIRATLSASAPSAPGVTACCGAACPTARRCRTAWLEDDDEEAGPDLRLPQREHRAAVRARPGPLAERRRRLRARRRPRLPAGRRGPGGQDDRAGPHRRDSCPRSRSSCGCAAASTCSCRG